jgi:hypothetical protein
VRRIDTNGGSRHRGFAGKWWLYLQRTTPHRHNMGMEQLRSEEIVVLGRTANLGHAISFACLNEGYYSVDICRTAKTADWNYVWLPDWQLESINSKHPMPLDLDIYLELEFETIASH